MDRRALVIVFASALVLCALVTKSHVAGWSDGSRIATVDALTANHTFAIDGSPYEPELGDKIRYRGHTYSDKPPLLSLLASAVAFAVFPLGITLRQTPAAAIYIVSLFTVGIWLAVGCCYAYAFQRLLGFEPRMAYAVAALTAVGTLVLPYATVLVNHVPCGAAALAACYHLVRARRGGRFDATLGGLFLSLAYAFDAAAALFAIAAVVLLWGASPRTWFVCAAAGLPVVALQGAYNVAISGSVLPTAYNAAVWSDPALSPLSHLWATRILRVFPLWTYLRFTANELLGPRGLFSFTPLMLIVVYGLARMWRSAGLTRQVAIAIVATTIVFIVAIIFLQDDSENPDFGERRYVDLFFVLGVPLGFALRAIQGRLAALGARSIVALSIAIAALGTIQPYGGLGGEWGFAFAAQAFADLARRSRVQAALDVVLMAVLIVAVLRLTPLANGGRAELRRGVVAQAN